MLQLVDGNSLVQVVLSPGLDPTYKGVVTGWLAADLLTGKDFLQLQGSATVQDVRLLKAVITTVGNGTGVGTFAVSLLRETTACTTNGTATAVTGQPCDGNDPAATATMKTFTHTVTNGTGSIVLATGRLSVNGTSATGMSLKDQIVFDFGADYSKAPVLHGAGDYLAFRCTGGAPTNSVTDIELYWSEGSV
jgi:hypothetical protein